MAVALSPLSPLGPVRPVYPDSGIAFDWTVLGIGLAVLIVGLGAMAFALAYRGAPHRVAAAFAGRPSEHVEGRARRWPRRDYRRRPWSGCASPSNPGRGRTAVPVRSALLGAVLAVALVVATLTFGSGLQSLVSHPALYGWNFSYLLNASNTTRRRRSPSSTTTPTSRRGTATTTTIAEIDGQSLPFLFEYGHSTVKEPISPPILTGHAVEARTRSSSGRPPWRSCTSTSATPSSVTYGTPGSPVYLPPTRLVVVGTATMPAVGYSSVIDDHTSMGTGALMSDAGPARRVPAGAVELESRRSTGRTWSSCGCGPASRPRRVSPTCNASPQPPTKVFAAVPDGAGQGDTVSVVGVQRPAEIVNYRTMGVTPALLASALAAGAIVALGLTLAASVRRRRRDLALLKTLGFTQRQLWPPWLGRRRSPRSSGS